MGRGTFVFRNGRLVEKGGPDDMRPARARGDFPAPMLIRDEIPALRGMHDGRLYDSKSTLRRSYREHGFVEVGNDAPTTTRDNARPISKAEIGEAYRKVRDGYKPAPLEYGELPPDAA